jgi:hypothetical protein
MRLDIVDFGCVRHDRLCTLKLWDANMVFDGA